MSVKIEKFVNGLNNVTAETDMDLQSVRVASNVDFTTEGTVRRRKGYTEVYTGTGIHSFYKNYFLENGTLKYLNEDFSATTLISGFSSKLLSYTKVNDILYFSNEDNCATIQGEWGVEDVKSPPVISIGNGGLKAGQYLISIAYMSSSGELGGALSPIVITVPNDNGAIIVGQIAQPDAEHSIIVYCSSANSDELFEHSILAKSTTSLTITSVRTSGRSCDTLHMKQVIPGHIIRHFKGRIYIADGSTLWYTEAMRYGLYSPASNFFNFPKRISIVQETEQGIFVVSDKTYFLSGTDPKEMTMSIVGDFSAVEGTGLAVDAKNFKMAFNGKCAYWCGENGAVLGLPDGQVKYLTQDKLAMDVTATHGVSGYREHDSIKQLVTNLFEQNSDGASLVASDSTTAQIIRNGIVLT